MDEIKKSDDEQREERATPDEVKREIDALYVDLGGNG